MKKKELVEFLINHGFIKQDDEKYIKHYLPNSEFYKQYKIQFMDNNTKVVYYANNDGWFPVLSGMLNKMYIDASGENMCGWNK